MVGPETQNALFPNLVLVLGTMKSVVSAERSLLRDRITADWLWQCDITNAGDLLLCAMCINSANLRKDNVLAISAVP